MLNVLIPLGSASQFFENPVYVYPKPLIDILGKPMIQHVIENLLQISLPKRFIFVVRDEDCVRYHLDSTLRLLIKDQIEILRIQRETKGAACSALLATEFIANDQPLVICNGDQIFDLDLNEALKGIHDDRVDAACLSFKSVHPRWSYVRLEGEEIIEAAEKHPLSANAVAGFYYFAKGSDFVDAAKRMILKDAQVNGAFYIAPVFNELVLAGKRMRAYEIDGAKYHTFYSPQKIQEYEIGRGKC
jgi:dTDP-glucose pyrophosphorylase